MVTTVVHSDLTSISDKTLQYSAASANLETGPLMQIATEGTCSCLQAVKGESSVYTTVVTLHMRPALLLHT